MEIIEARQGTEEWHRLRARYLTASEAPVIMGASKHTSRDELLAIKAEYEEAAFSEWQQRNLLDRGHQLEEAARPIAEELVGEDLLRQTGVNGRYLASFDGLTMLEEYGFEHKTLNQELKEALTQGDLPPEYYWQLEHQFIVCENLEKILFVASDGTRDNFHYLWYTPVKGRREKLIKGWDQFEKERANFQPQPKENKPAPAPVKDLPALTIAVTGEVVESNLPQFKDQLMERIRSINTELATDQDFVDAEQTVKLLKEAEEKLDEKKQEALYQSQSLYELLSTMDELRGEARKVRLDLNKQVEETKKRRRRELVEEYQQALTDAIGEASEEFQQHSLTVTGVTADFWGVIKGKKDFDKMRSALNDELARAKIAITEQAEHIRGSLQILQAEAGDHWFLFHDLQNLVGQSHDYLRLEARNRLQEYRRQQEAQAEAEKAGEEASQQAIPGQDDLDDTITDADYRPVEDEDHGDVEVLERQTAATAKVALTPQLMKLEKNLQEAKALLEKGASHEAILGEVDDALRQLEEHKMGWR